MKFMRKLNISCCNVHTLIDNPESSSPTRKTALICKESDRYNVDIAALSETLADDGQIKNIGSSYTIFWKVVRERVILSQSFMNCLEELMTD